MVKVNPGFFIGGKKVSSSATAYEGKKASGETVVVLRDGAKVNAKFAEDLKKTQVRSAGQVVKYARATYGEGAPIVELGREAGLSAGAQQRISDKAAKARSVVAGGAQVFRGAATAQGFSSAVVRPSPRGGFSDFGAKQSFGDRGDVSRRVEASIGENEKRITYDAQFASPVGVTSEWGASKWLSVSKPATTEWVLGGLSKGLYGLSDEAGRRANFWSADVGWGVSNAKRRAYRFAGVASGFGGLGADALRVYGEDIRLRPVSAAKKAAMFVPVGVGFKAVGWLVKGSKLGVKLYRAGGLVLGSAFAGKTFSDVVSAPRAERGRLVADLGYSSVGFGVGSKGFGWAVTPKLRGYGENIRLSDTRSVGSDGVRILGEGKVRALYQSPVDRLIGRTRVVRSRVKISGSESGGGVLREELRVTVNPYRVDVYQKPLVKVYVGRSFVSPRRYAFNLMVKGKLTYLEGAAPNLGRGVGGLHSQYMPPSWVVPEGYTWKINRNNAVIQIRNQAYHTGYGANIEATVGHELVHYWQLNTPAGRVFWNKKIVEFPADFAEKSLAKGFFVYKFSRSARLVGSRALGGEVGFDVSSRTRFGDFSVGLGRFDFLKRMSVRGKGVVLEGVGAGRFVEGGTSLVSQYRLGKDFLGGEQFSTGLQQTLKVRELSSPGGEWDTVFYRQRGSGLGAGYSGGGSIRMASSGAPGRVVSGEVGVSARRSLLVGGVSKSVSRFGGVGEGVALVSRNVVAIPKSVGLVLQTKLSTRSVLGVRSVVRSVSRSVPVVRGSLLSRTVAVSRSLPRMGVRSELVSRSEVLSRQIPVVRQSPVVRSDVRGVTRSDVVRGAVFVPTIPPPVVVGALWLDGKRRVGVRRGVGVGSFFAPRYYPSLEAVALGVRGVMPSRASVASGLMIRPLVR